MSMICSLKRATAADLQRLQAEPELVLPFVDGDEDSDLPPQGALDLDKAWHGLHFLLTGSAWEAPEPLGYLVGGGEELGDEEIGYAPPRVLQPQQVAAFATALEQVSSADLRERFDPKTMMEEQIYPEIWDRDPREDDTLGYLLERFEALKTFVAESSAAGDALVVVLF